MTWPDFVSLWIWERLGVFEFNNEVNGTTVELPRSRISLANVLKHADSFT